MKKSEVTLYILFFLLSIVALLSFRQIKAFKEATEALGREKYIEAVDGFCEVIYNHIPFSPLEKKAIDSIYGVIRTADKMGDQTLKLYAIEMLRRSIYGIRHISTPHSAVLEDINRLTIELRSHFLVQDGYSKSLSETEAEMKGIVEKELAPNPWISFITICVFLGYLLFAFWSISNCTNHDRILMKEFLVSISILLILALGWAMGFYLC